MATLAIALASLAFGLNRIDTSRFFDSVFSLQVWPFLLLTAALLPLFWYLEKRAADPIVPPSLLGTRQLRVANTITFGAGLGEVAVLFMPALAVAAFAVTSSSASFMLMPLVFALFIGSPVAGRLLDRIGSRIVILGGIAFLAAGALCMGLLGDLMWGFYVASILIGFGLAALLGAPIRYISMNEAPAEVRGSAQGVVTISTSIGQLVGAALVGAVAASAGGGVTGYQRAFLVLSIIMVALFVLGTQLKSRGQEQASYTGQISESGAENPVGARA
jgi:MFS family permease